MPQLLLELFQEEIPARMQRQAAEDLKRLMVKALAERGLPASDVTARVTPRRLTLVIEDLPAASAAVSEELKGPRTSAPPTALDGFLKKTGLTKDQLAVQADPKGDFYIAKIEKDGRPAAPLIAEAIVETVRAFPWPKSMKWEDSGLQWVRPLRSILCLFDGAIVPVEIAGLTASNVTRGHRQMANEPFEVRDFADYEMKLAERRVILDREERKAMIDEQAEVAAANAGLVFRDDDELLEEVAGLVEYPVVLTGAFDPAFLQVPQEVLIGTMRKNQKYFALTDANGKLAEKFLIVSNLEARDGGNAIIAGNERVLRARLSDAKFFWDNDKAITLEARLPKLEQIVFHSKVGSVGDRVRRLESMVLPLSMTLGVNSNDAAIAAHWSKADLVSGTVGEFPEVQGIIGGYLAKEAGASAAISDALHNQYRYVAPQVDAPTVATVLSIADKVDSIVALWVADERPSGSRDPYGLRRSAQGYLSEVLSCGARLPFFNLVLGAYVLARTDRYRVSAKDGQLARGQIVGQLSMSLAEIASMFSDSADQNSADAFNRSAVLLDQYKKSLEILAFVRDRASVALRASGFRHDVLDATLPDLSLIDLSEIPEPDQQLDDKEYSSAFHAQVEKRVRQLVGSSDDFVLLVRRIEALQAFLATDDGKNLVAGTKRAANILRIEEKKDGKTYNDAVDAALLRAPEEEALVNAFYSAVPRIVSAIKSEDFAAAMTALAALRAPVDAFFDKVKVNDDDKAVRANRLNLLARIKQAAGLVADFSKIEG